MNAFKQPLYKMPESRAQILAYNLKLSKFKPAATNESVYITDYS
jgi:hypothetical protein